MQTTAPSVPFPEGKFDGITLYLKSGEVILEAGEALDEFHLLLLARRQRLLDVLQLSLEGFTI